MGGSKFNQTGTLFLTEAFSIILISIIALSIIIDDIQQTDFFQLVGKVWLSTLSLEQTQFTGFSFTAMQKQKTGFPSQAKKF